MKSFILGTQFNDLYERNPILVSAAGYLTGALEQLIVSAAPDAEAERRFLRGALPADQDPLAIWDRSVGGLLHDIAAQSPEEATRVWGRASPAPLEPQRQSLRAILLADLDGTPADMMNAPDGTAFLSSSAVGEAFEELDRLLAWCRQLCDFRIRNIDQIFKLFGPERLGANIIAPALVDFARWLPDPQRTPIGDAPRVSIPDQVALMEELIKQRPGVHPFVPVDPLLDWQETTSLLNRCFSRDGQGRTGNGFAGVKLYPPMGFAPLDNEHLASIDPAWPLLVRGNLEKLYRYCSDFDVPIMAHCNQSNDTAVSRANRTAVAEKWWPVVTAYQSLRISLAHFGGIPNFALGDGAQQETIGAMMDAHPSLYADFADETGVRDPVFRAGFVRALGAFLAKNRERTKRIMYGTDWSMLGMEFHYQAYFNDWYTTFREAALPGDGGATLDLTDVDAFFGGNAMSFLGWRTDTRSRERLRSFYRENFGSTYVSSLAWLSDAGSGT